MAEEDYTEPTPGLEPVSDPAPEPASPPPATDEREAAAVQRWLQGDQREPQQDRPVFGTSPLARQLEEEGVFARLQADHAAERGREEQRAVEESQGWSPSSTLNSVVDYFRSGRREPLPEGSRPRTVGDWMRLTPRERWAQFEAIGRLTPEEGQEAARLELETRQATAPLARQFAEGFPQLAPGQLRGAGVAGGALNIGRGLAGAVAVRQEQALARAQAMLRGEAEPPQYEEWRALTETGGRTIAEMFSSLPLQYAGIIGGYAVGAAGGRAEFVDNRLYQFGQQVERSVQQAFPNDPARQFEFSHTLVQGLASTLAFGGQGMVAHLLGSGPKGQLALIALSGMAAQTPHEFARVTQAMANGTAQERDRIMITLANSALGATEAVPFANTTGAVGRLARGVEQGFEETIQESVQTAGQNVMRRFTYDPSQDPYEGVAEAMVVAAISGFGYGGAFPGSPGAAQIPPQREARLPGGPSAPRAPTPQPPQAAPVPEPDAAREQPADITAPTPAPGAPQPSEVAPTTSQFDESGFGMQELVAPEAPQAPVEAAPPVEAPPAAVEPEEAPAATPAAPEGIPEAAPVERERLTRLPSFDDLTARLPLDADGNPDIAGLQQRMQERYGVSNWAELNLPQRVELFRQLGVEAREREAQVPQAPQAPAVLPPVPAEPEGQLREAIDRILEDRPEEVADAARLAERFAPALEAQAEAQQRQVSELSRIVTEQLPQWRGQFEAALLQRGISQEDTARLVDESVQIIGAGMQEAGAAATLETLKKYAYEEGQRQAIEAVDRQLAGASARTPQAVTATISGSVPRAAAGPTAAPAARAEPAAAGGAGRVGTGATGTAAQSAGPQRTVAAPPGTGAERAGPAGAPAAQPAGGAERGLRTGEPAPAGGAQSLLGRIQAMREPAKPAQPAVPVVTEPTRSQRLSFSRILQSKRPLKWASVQTLLKATPEQLEALRKEALTQGLLRQTKGGVYRRNPTAIAAAMEAQQAGPVEGPALVVPPDIRVDNAIRVHEEQTGRQVSPSVREYAVELFSRLGFPSFVATLDRAKADKGLSADDVRDLAAVAGTPVAKRASRTVAFAAVEARHKDHVAFLERQAAEATIAVELAAFSDWNPFRARRATPSFAEWFRADLAANGFDVEEVLYQGAAGEPGDPLWFDTTSHTVNAYWFTPSRDDADGWAEVALAQEGETRPALVQAVYIRPGKTFTVSPASGVPKRLLEKPNKWHADVAIRFDPKFFDQVLEQARKEGVDTVRFKNVVDMAPTPFDQVVVFSKDNIATIPQSIVEGGPPINLASFASATSDGQSQRAELDALGFYSRTLEAAKSWPQPKGTPEQALQHLLKAGTGVKNEIEATKIREFLAGKKSVTREEIVSYLRENRVEVREAVYGGPELQEGARVVDRETLRQERGVAQEMPLRFYAIDADGTIIGGGSTYENAANLLAARRAKWSQHSLDPSNPTYMETVLHLPPAPMSKEKFKIYRFGDTSAVHPEQLEEEYADYIRDVGSEYDHSLTFQSGHFPEPNAIGHVQSSLQVDKDGETTFVPSQVQSDWSQQIRDRTRDAVAKQMQEPRLQELATRRQALEQEIKALDPIVRAGEARWGQEPTEEQATAYRRTDEARDEIRQIVREEGDLRTVRFQDLTPDQKKAVSAAISSARQKGELPAGARDEGKIAELRKRIDRLKGEPAEGAETREQLIARLEFIAQDRNHPQHFDAADVVETMRDHGWTREQFIEQSRDLNGRQETENLRRLLYPNHAALALAEAELATAEAATPSHPFVKSTGDWLPLALKHVIRQAIAAGAKSISIPSGATVLTYNPGQEEGMEGFYDDIVPLTLGKILKGLDPSIKPHKVKTVGSPVDGRQLPDKGEGGFTVFPITDKVVERVNAEGMALFALSSARSRLGPEDGREAPTLRYLKPGEALPSVTEPASGDTVMVIERGGKPVGHVDFDLISTAEPGEAGDTAYIQYINVVPGERLSLSDIRAMREEFRREHPTVTRFEGFRVSGARGQQTSFDRSWQAVVMAALEQGRQPPPYTDAFASRIPEVVTSIEGWMRKMLPPEIAVRVVDRLVSGPYNIHGRYTFLEGNGRILDKAVEVALTTNQGVTPLRVTLVKAFHEITHALREYGRLPGGIYGTLLTDKEWQIVVERAKKIGIDKQLRMRDQNGKLIPVIPVYRKWYREQLRAAGFTGEVLNQRVEELLNQERVANLAEQWATGTSFGARIDSFFERIVKFFEAIRNAVNGLGFQTYDDVFQRVTSGEVAVRAVGRREPTFIPFPNMPTPVEVHLSSEEGQEARGLFPALSGKFTPNRPAVNVEAEGAAFKESMRALVARMQLDGATKRALNAAVADLRKDTLVRLRALDANKSQIAEVLGTSFENVGEYIDQLLSRGLIEKQPPGLVLEHRARLEANKQAIIDDYTAGANVKALVRKYDHAAETIAAMLKQAGVYSPRRQQLGPSTSAQVVELRRQGYGPKEIGLILHLKKNQVRWMLRKHRDRVRSRAEQVRSGIFPANDGLNAWLGLPPGTEFYADAAHIATKRADKDDADTQGDLSTPEAVYDNIEYVLANATLAWKRPYGNAWTILALSPEGEKVIGFDGTFVHGRANLPTTYNSKHGKNLPRLLAALNRHGLGAIKWNPIAADEILTLIGQAPPQHTGSLRQLISALRQEQEFSVASFASERPAPETRQFSIPGLPGQQQEDGTVTEKIKEAGERLRTYAAGGSNFILSEQPDGSWELTFFRAEPDHVAHVVNMIRAIEADIGKPISPRGWLTPEGYQYWSQVSPEKVKFHVNAGELFGGMFASPRAVEFAEAVLAEAAARGQDAAMVEYRGQHGAPDAESGSPIHDVTLNGIYPSDFYGSQGLRYYGTGNGELDAKAYAKIQSLRGKPNTSVTVYRAVPHEPTVAEQLATLEKQMAAYMRRKTLPPEASGMEGSDWYDTAYARRDELRNTQDKPAAELEIIPGDWVAINREYAKDHGEGALNGKYNILSKSVPARELFTAGGSLLEWGWSPPPAQAATPEIQEASATNRGSLSLEATEPAHAHLSRLKSSIPQEAFQEARREERYSLASEPQLDMSPEARKARAEAMGFTIVAYHGTKTPTAFEAFDVALAGTSNKTTRGHVETEALWFSQNPKTASVFADASPFGFSAEEHARIMPVRIRMSNPLIVDSVALSRKLLSDKILRPRPDTEIADISYIKERALNDALQGGHDGVIFKNGYDGIAFEGDLYAVFDPVNVRSAFAAFDPSQEGSPVLLASFVRERAPNFVSDVLQAAQSTVHPKFHSMAFISDVHAAWQKLRQENAGVPIAQFHEMLKPAILNGDIEAIIGNIMERELFDKQRASTYDDGIRKWSMIKVPASFTIASFASNQSPGQGPQLPTTPVSQGAVRSLADTIADLKSSLGMTTTQGLYGLGVRPASGGRTRWFRPRGIRGQYDPNAGVARIRISTDIDAFAKEGGHHLERVFGAPMEQFKQDHAEELAVPTAPDAPLPALNPTGFSGKELDADTQRVLVEAATNYRAWQQVRAQPKRNQATLYDVTAQAAISRATLQRRLGRTIGDALIADLVRVTGRPEVDYVRERYSATGTPQPRIAATPSQTAVSEGFAEFFRRYITDPDTVKREMPGVYVDFEDFLDANDPFMLQDLERVQLEVVSADYKAHRLATASERLAANVASTRDQTSWEQVKEFYQVRDQRERVDQWLSTFSYNVMDLTNPALKMQQHLQQIMFENGIRDSNGRPITFLKRELPHAQFRMFPQAFKIGHETVVNGVTDYGSLVPSGPNLVEAITDAMGGTGYFQWTEKKIDRFAAYLEAQTGIVYWAIWAKQNNRPEAAQWAALVNQYYNSPTIAHMLATLEDAPTWASEPSMTPFDEYWKAAKEYEQANASWRGAAQKVREWNHRLLLLKWQAGLPVNYQKFAKRKEFYSPFNRKFGEEEGAFVPPGVTALKLFGGFKRIKGSKRPVVNVLATMARDAYATAEVIQRNDMIRAFADLSDRAGPGGGQVVERVRKEETLPANQRTFEKIADAIVGMGYEETDARSMALQMEGEIQDNELQILYDPTRTPKGAIILPFFENGERKLIRFNDVENGRRLLAAMNTLGRGMSGVMLNIVAAPAGILRSGVIMHPAYTLGNVAGDIQQTWFLTGAPPVLTHMRGAFHELSGYPKMRALMQMFGIRPSDVAQMQDRLGLIGGGQLTASIAERGGNRRNLDLINLRNKGYQTVDVRAVLGTGSAIGGAVAGGLLGTAAGPVVGGLAGFGLGGAAGAAAGATTGERAARFLRGDIGIGRLEKQLKDVRRRMKALDRKAADFTLRMSEMQATRAELMFAIQQMKEADKAISTRIGRGVGKAVGGTIGGLVGGIGGAAVAPVMGPVVGATVGFSGGMMAGRLLFGQGAEAVFAKVSEFAETAGRRGVAEYATKRTLTYNPNMPVIDAMREGVFTANDVMPFDRRGFLTGAVMRIIPFFNGNVQGVSKVYRQAWMVEGDRGRIISVPTLQGGLLGAGGAAAATAIFGGPVGWAMGAGALTGAAVGRWALGKTDIEAMKLYLRHMLRRRNATGPTEFERMYSRADEETMRRGFRAWVMLSIIGVMGGALLLIHGGGDDKNEYADNNRQVKNTHWVFKMFDTWVRLKRFEIGLPAIVTEALIGLVRNGDPLTAERIRDGIVATHTPPLIPQIERDTAALMTGVDVRTGRPITPEHLRRLPPYMRYHAYSSEFARSWAEFLNQVGIRASPVAIDYALNSQLGYWGREVQLFSNYFSNRRQPGADPREIPLLGPIVNRFTWDPYRSTESIIEVRRIMRDGQNPYIEASEGYSALMRDGASADRLRTHLVGLQPDQTIYAVLMQHFPTADRATHPLNRAQQIDQILFRIRREMRDQGTISTAPGRERGTPIVLSPSLLTQTERVMQRISALEMWNALHDVGRAGWAHREVRDVGPLYQELEASSPAIYNELIRRFRSGKLGDGVTESPVGDYAQDRAAWIRVQERVIRMIERDNMLGLQRAWDRKFQDRRGPTRRRPEDEDDLPTITLPPRQDEMQGPLYPR